VAVLYNYTTRPLYQATAQILIDRDTPNVLPTKELLEMAPGGSDYYATQYQLLKGRSLAERVVEKLNLQKTAEFQTGPLMSPWERVQQRFFGKPPKKILDPDGIPLPPATAAFRSRLEVEPQPGGRLVNLRFTAYDPQLAAGAANALARVYIQQSLEFRYTTSSEATGWLSERLAEQKKKLETAEKALQEYIEREGLVKYEDRQGLEGQKMTALSAALMEARTQRIAKESLYNQMRSLPSSQLESYPLVMSSPLVMELKSRLAEHQREYARLSEVYGERHPDMIRVRGEIRDAESKLQAEIHNVVRSVENDYRTAASQEASLRANLESAKRDVVAVDKKTIEYGVLKREVESQQQLYKDLLNRTKETGLEGDYVEGLKSMKSTNIRVVEEAEVPGGPITPRKMRNYQLALLIGLALGFGLAVLFENLDNTLKTPEDVKEHLGLPFLGMVPDVGARAKGSPVAVPSPLILKNPRSAVAEAYRVLRTNLIFSSAETRGRALLISSANPGEGKTTTVTNLAASLALNGARVLAMDADLRRPTMHQHFGISKTPGLSDLIVGKAKAGEAIQTTRFKGLQVLPCGYVPPNPAELLGSASIRQVIDALRDLYDWVLIDTPPILAMADTPVLCPVVDGVVLVVGAEVSGRPAIQRAIDQILSVGGKITGVVLNKVDLERNSYYYGQYYGEYYRSYYAEGAQPRPVAGPRPIRRSNQR
jgi:polysaccharide biosynthesis transport protein